MRALGVVLCSLLLAGTGTSSEVRTVEINAGGNYTFNSPFALNPNVAACILTTPSNEIIIFKHGEDSPNAKYALQDYNGVIPCSITLQSATASDSGVWIIANENVDGSGSSESFELVVTGASIDNPEAPAEAKITWLNPIQFPTRTNQSIDLSLSKKPYAEDCYIIPPGGEKINTANAHILGVDIHNENSDYVSCRITIGPMEDSLLGEWTLCSKPRDNNEQQERCQITNIAWNNNVTTMSDIKRAVNLGTKIEIEVTSIDNVDSCQFETPSGELKESLDGATFVNVNGRAECRLSIGPITEKLLGNWTIIGKFSTNNRYNEIKQPFRIIQEDPENPIIEEDRIVDVLNEQQVMTDMGSSHDIIVNVVGFVTGETCHVRTPAGLQYQIMDGFHIPGVTVIKNSNIECGITVSVDNEDAVGTWTLIARATRFSEPIERRLPFTINVEEIVEAVPKDIVVVAGNSLYVRLINPTDQYQTCKLYEPDGSISHHAPDPTNAMRCGYFITNITATDEGIWEIVYGSRKIYRARIIINLASAGADMTFSSNIDLIHDRAVNVTVGPSNAIYCRLVNPNGVPVFDDFGMCRLSVDKVTSDHAGAWQMIVATEGKVIADEHQLFVTIRESESKAAVSTSVATNKPTVTLTCGLAVDATVRACKFRDPHGRILLASGVTEDRFTSTGVQTSYASQIRSHECGLQITNPEVSDLGLWRCAFETEEETYYGFLTVICPWAIQVPEIAAVVQQHPILKAHKSGIEAVEDEPVTMSCSVEAAIKYCYFRYQNGTVFTVSPGMSSNDMEYVGAGLDAGECGLRFNSMKHRDSGRWSCHVGLVSEDEEQRTEIQLTVLEAMRTEHRRLGNTMVVEGLVHDARALDYCRFVRMDGFGFTTGSNHMPANYRDTSSVSHGICQLTATDPTILDLHPWTIVAKVRGQDHEISRDTMDSIVLEMPTPEGGDNDVDHIHVIANRTSALGIAFYVLMSVLLLAILLGVWLGPKKHREWTYARTTAMRNSFMRTSIRKEPLPPQEPPKYEQTV